MADAELMKRLGKLERDNQRLKRGGLALLVLLVAVTTIYATRPAPQKITAHEFDVVDNAGAVLAEMSAGKGEPSLHLNGTNGGQITLDPTGIDIYSSGGLLMLLGGGSLGSVVAGPQISFFGLSNPGGEMNMGVERGMPNISLEGRKPNISLSDAQGYSMDLGSTSTIVPATGQTQSTSADSIIMFGNGKKHRVIWQAP